MALRSFLPQDDIAHHMEDICVAAARVPEDPLKTWTKYAQQGDFERARAVAEELIERRRNHWLGHDLLGHVFSSTGRIEEALVCARRALSLEEDNGGLVARVGSVLMLLGRYEEALPYFSRSTILWNDVRPWLWYTDCLRRVGRAEDARRVVADATARFGDVPELSRLAAELNA